MASTSRSLGAPSRFVYVRGISPLAYVRSRYSTTSGRKLALGSGSRAITAVQITRLSPMDATTAPSVSRASRPVSNPMDTSALACPSSTCSPSQ